MSGLKETLQRTRYGGAVYALNSFINMTGAVNFDQNSAQWGGAVAFSNIGTSSKLQLTEPLTASFTKNSATLGGGAIFFQDNISVHQLCIDGTITSTDCFIELSSGVNIRLNFDNNNATTGRIFYGGYLDTCTPLVSGMYSYGERLLDTVVSISNVHVNASNPKEDVSNISSDPIQVCICKIDSLECNHIEMETVRGQEFTLQAVIVGQSDKKVYPSAARISLSNGVQISATQRIQNTGKECTNISYSLFAESDTTVVTLFPDNGPCSDIGIARTIISVKFCPCPKGFIQNSSECVCEERLQKFNVLCNVSDNSIQ